jgi:hypothetical protein
MKAISIRWPYVEDILRGTKKIEYRSWPTKYRGDLLICSSQTPEWEHSGHAVCIVEVYKLVLGEDGYWKWHLRKVRPIKPFPVKGRLGLYEVVLPKGR